MFHHQWHPPAYNNDPVTNSISVYKQCKAPVPPLEPCCSVPGAVKNVYHRSLPFNKRWPPLRKRRIRSVTAYGSSYRSESFERHTILRAARKGQFSAPAKFIAAITTLSQSFAPLDASSWTVTSVVEIVSTLPTTMFVRWDQGLNMMHL